MKKKIISVILAGTMMMGTLQDAEETKLQKQKIKQKVKQRKPNRQRVQKNFPWQTLLK